MKYSCILALITIVIMSDVLSCSYILGLVYGRLLGISSNTLKTDIINLFEGCKLTLDDIKVDYDRAYNPMAM